MEELESCLKRRRALRAVTTKFVNKCEQFLNEENTDKELALVYLEQVKDKHRKLQDLDSQIQMLTISEELEEDTENCEGYYEKIIAVRTALNKKIHGENLIEPAKQNADKTILGEDLVTISEENSNCKNRIARGIKLPVINIERFSGDIAKWQNFWGKFENAIDLNDELSEIEKLNYLFSLVTGEAEQTISGFALTANNYKEAIKLLSQRYGREDLIIHTHINKLLTLTPVKSVNHTVALRKLYDQVEIQIRNLKNLKIYAPTYGIILTPIILKLLPYDINLEFQRSRKNKRVFDIEELLDFLREDIQCREMADSLTQVNNFHKQKYDDRQYRNRPPYREQNNDRFFRNYYIPPIRRIYNGVGHNNQPFYQRNVRPTKNFSNEMRHEERKEKQISEPTMRQNNFENKEHKVEKISDFESIEVKEDIKAFEHTKVKEIKELDDEIIEERMMYIEETKIENKISLGEKEIKDVESSKDKSCEKVIDDNFEKVNQITPLLIEFRDINEKINDEISITSCDEIKNDKVGVTNNIMDNDIQESLNLNENKNESPDLLERSFDTDVVTDKISKERENIEEVRVKVIEKVDKQTEYDDSLEYKIDKLEKIKTSVNLSTDSVETVITLNDDIIIKKAKKFPRRGIG